MSLKLGFIGLGIMGKPMALNLLTASQTLYVYNRSRNAVDEISSKGAHPCESCKEVAQNSNIIFTMLPNTQDVETVLFGENGIAEGVLPGSIVVDMSTISPVATKDFARRLAILGVEMLDAPVSGGQIGAEKAELSIMIGGKPAVIDSVMPYLKIMGKTITRIGGNGAGQVCKLANQIVIALTLEGIAEAFVFVAKSGVDPQIVREALLGGAAQSRVLEVQGNRMVQRNFSPGFRIRLHQKDLKLAIEVADTINVKLPATRQVLQTLDATATKKGDNLDHSAIILALETLATENKG